MREIRLYGSEGGGAGCSPYPYQVSPADWIPAFAGMTGLLWRERTSPEVV